MANKKQGKVNVPILVMGLVVTLGLVAVLGSGFGKDPHRLEVDALEGKAAPRFFLEDLDGQPHSLADSIGKEWVVINFWSTWCGPCKMEHPELLKAAELWPDVKWVGMVYQDDPVKIRRYLQMKGAAYPHLVDPSGAISVDYGVTGVPETFFINPQGVVVKKFAEPIGLGQIAAVFRDNGGPAMKPR
ncbi:MAG: TlpA family protein disulfide reductase [Myxococcales bacterium]|nr:TlpA family protein disulfide reductase [Myxococcales bacterium]